jgi:hypothetical protein
MTLAIVRSAAASLRHTPEETVVDAIRSAMLGCADRERGRARVALLETRNQLRSWVEEAAGAAAVSLDPVVVSVDLTDMPALEIPQELLELKVERPRLAPYRESRIAQRIAEKGGAAIESALRQLETQLRAWTRSGFARMSAQFASQIEPLRAPVELLATKSTEAIVERSDPSGAHEMPED